MFLLEKGPIVDAQSVAKVYTSCKSLKFSITPASLYETVCKYLNIVQIYIHGKAYLIENRGNDVIKVIETLESIANRQGVINSHIEKSLKDVFTTSLEYLIRHTQR